MNKMGLKKTLAILGGVAGIGCVVTAGIFYTRKINKQQIDIYNKLKNVIVLMCKYDDYFDQMDMMESREAIANILCDLESKCGKKNELCKLVPWMFYPD